MKRHLFALYVCFTLVASHVFADYNIGNVNDSIKISFNVGGNNQSVELNAAEVVQVLRDSPLKNDIYVDNYKIDIWVFAALQALKSDFSTETKKSSNSHKTTITEIDGFKNNSKCEWIYFVNGNRSKYYISTQLDSNVKDISFVYECRE